MLHGWARATLKSEFEPSSESNATTSGCSSFLVYLCLDSFLRCKPIFQRHSDQPAITGHVARCFSLLKATQLLFLVDQERASMLHGWARATFQSEFESSSESTAIPGRSFFLVYLCLDSLMV